MSDCQACSAHNDDAARFCAACGAAMQPAPVASESVEHEQPVEQSVPAWATVTAPVAHATESVGAPSDAMNGNGIGMTHSEPIPSAPESSDTGAPAPAPAPAPPFSVPMAAASTPDAPAERSKRSWVPVVVTAAVGIVIAIVLGVMWQGARSDADSNADKLNSTQQTLETTKSNLVASKKATAAAKATVATERAALSTANHDLADAKQHESGLQNSVDGYKRCGADLGDFFRALDARDTNGAARTLIIAKLECDRIDPAIVPIAIR